MGRPQAAPTGSSVFTFGIIIGTMPTQNTVSGDNLIPVFIPGLSAELLMFEQKKRTPLSEDEVNAVLKKAVVIMLPRDEAQKVTQARLVREIDPNDAWNDFQLLKRELDEKRSAESGPRE